MGQACEYAQMTTSDNAGEPITEAGLAALKEEIGQLETVARRDIAARILTARGHGDLKENAEYHAAKEDQAHLETRILRLRKRLRAAVVVDPEAVAVAGGGGTMTFARPAEIRDLTTDEVHTWTIVGAAEADRAHGKLSAESPVARALLNAAVGDTIEVPTPKGTRRLRIERLV
jgi:transcription elongation factor GreA